MKIVIGVDVDTVLANFNNGYRWALAEVSGRELIPQGEEPPVWNYAPHYGYTKEEDAAAWKLIHESDSFWEYLEPVGGAENFLCRLAELVYSVEREVTVYFITTRKGKNVKTQTEQWLSNHGAPWPTVLITGSASDKGRVARALGVTHFIDDNFENCAEVKVRKPDATVFLMNARYNEYQNEARLGIVRVNALTEVIQSLQDQGVTA